MQYKHPLPILSRDCHTLESVKKIAVTLVNGLRHVPYEAALQRLQLFSLVRRKFRGDLIWMHKIMHGLLNFPDDTAFAASTRLGLKGHAFKIHQQRCKTHCRQQVFSVRVDPYWNKLPEEIVNPSSVEKFQLRLDARWQSLFPEINFLPVTDTPSQLCSSLPYPTLMLLLQLLLVVYGSFYCSLDR